MLIIPRQHFSLAVSWDMGQNYLRWLLCMFNTCHVAALDSGLYVIITAAGGVSSSSMMDFCLRKIVGWANSPWYFLILRDCLQNSVLNKILLFIQVSLLTPWWLSGLSCSPVRDTLLHVIPHLFPHFLSSLHCRLSNKMPPKILKLLLMLKISQVNIKHHRCLTCYYQE